MEWSISLLRHFKIQTLLKINCCMAVISSFRVTQHSQIFSLFLRNRIQCIALYQLRHSPALLNLGPVHMIPGQLIAPGQLTDPGVNFASVHGLTPVTVHMSFSLPRGNFERRVTRCTTPGNRLAEATFLHVNRTQKLPPGKSSLAHAYYRCL